MADLNSLAIFAKVVEAKGFSEVARRLNIPLSTVSRRVAELEDQLGVRLFERSTRHLRLTDVGADVLDHAQRSAELSEAVDTLVSNQLSTVAGVLRLSAPPSISDTLLAPLLGAFQASYPNIRVQVLVTDRFVDLIAEGIDLVFRLGAPGDSSLVGRKILTYGISWLRAPLTLKESTLRNLQGICSITGYSHSRIGNPAATGPFGTKTEKVRKRCRSNRIYQ
jgi:DNA-binding transcriptional LysR family regulator